MRKLQDDLIGQSLLVRGYVRNIFEYIIFKVQNKLYVKNNTIFLEGMCEYEISKSGYNGMLSGSQRLPCGGGLLSCKQYL